jgi:hypothetical protein
MNPKQEKASPKPVKAKAEPRPITADMVKAAVTSRDDFAFEIRVRALLGEHGASNVRHGWSYLDPVEEKPRQFDLRGELHHFRGVRSIQLAIECKNLDPKVPLVISGTARTYEEAYHHFINSGALERGVFVAGPDVRGVYHRYKFVGRSIARLTPKDAGLEVSRREDEADIYKRWSQALASAADPAKAAATNQNVQTVVIPAVVVPDGSLWEVFYDEIGNIQDEPKLVDETTFFVGHEVVLEPGNLWIKLSHVQFFTVAGLNRFLASLTPTTADWNEWFPDKAERYSPPVH